MARLPRTFALLAALASSPACILVGEGTTITSESDSGSLTCEDPNSHLEGETCYCNDGYDFCSDDLDDLSCCPIGATTTDPGTTTDVTPTTAVPTTAGPTSDDSTTGPVVTDGTSTATTTETSTATTEDTDTTATSEGTTTGGEQCQGPQEPPDGCQDGQFWCTMSELCGPEGSEVFRCDNGVWLPEPNIADDSCNLDGYDFAYGCIDDGQSVAFICGDGPGTTCEATDPSSCADDVDLAQCVYGKLTHYDCLVQCTEVGDAMMTLYDHGFCGEDMGVSVCLCCDMGDPGCPI